MEPLLPSEIARLVYGYLKKEQNEETAKQFLQSSSHLTECYQMFKNNQNFNIKVNGFNLHDIFNLFGTMCHMINERISEKCKSKTLIEKLEYLLDVNHKPTKEDKCVETESNMVDKCIGDVVNTQDKSLNTMINMEGNNITEVLEIPSFSKIISSKVTETEKSDSIYITSKTVENISVEYASPSLSSTTQLINNTSKPIFSNIDENEKFDVTNTQEKSTHTTINIETNNSAEVLEIPSFSNMISNNVSETKEIDSINNTTSKTVEKNPVEYTSSSLSSTTQLINTSTPIVSKTENKDALEFQINDQICSTPVNSDKPILNFSPQKCRNQFSPGQLECQQIPEATSLESMPGLSKEDRPKNNSVVVDTGELVDTFLSDRSLLEKIADSINKSIEAQRGGTNNVQDGKILNSPALEKALDSTQSDPQIKNVLDEFLVFNVDNTDGGKKTCTIEHQDTIKSRLRSAKKKDDAHNKPKKNIPKHVSIDNEEGKNYDNNIILMMNEDVNMTPTYFEHCEVVSNQFILQAHNSNVEQSSNLNTVEIEPEEDYLGKLKYVKIAPKFTSVVKTHTPILEKSIFPKRKKRPFEEPSVRSKFRRSNIITVQKPELVSSPSIIIEVPNQNSFETIAKNNIEIDNIIRLPEASENSKVSSEVKDEFDHDTPDDRLKPPKTKSLSTPRRRSTHIRCLDFSTPQPKNLTRDQARSKLFCDTPKRHETIDESSESPLPKLQADWGSVNGFESIVKKETAKFWDTDIREMVGAGILTSDADGRKSRKKKTPRKKIRSANDKNNSELVEDQNKSNSLIQTNESHSNEINQSNNSEKMCILSEQNNCNRLLLDDQKSVKEQSKFPLSFKTPDKATELCFGEPLDKSDFLKSVNEEKSFKKQNEYPILLETSIKTVESYKELPPVETKSSKTINDQNSLKEPSAFPIPLETPSKIIELHSELIESNSSNDSCQIVNNLEPSKNNINEEENNVNQSNTLTTAKKLVIISNSKIVPEIINKNQKEDSNFLETFNNQNFVKPLLTTQPENNLNEQSEHFNLKDQIETNHPNELHSPLKSINTFPPIKHNLIETPFKCDDAAVDVPETPISKLIRECDPSKLVTPLPCTPEHCEDSLTETPLTKIFRETSYLNRPPISPFPPTPGNSRSVDTLLLSSEQECSRTLNSLNSKINNINDSKEILPEPIPNIINDESSVKLNKIIKPTPVNAKLKLSTRTKVKSASTNKTVEEKKKQVYECVKVELFGSEISSSSSADELENIKEQSKKIIINKKKEIVKTSGFKPIPKRKSIQSTSFVINGIENHLLDEFNTKCKKSLPIIPTIEHNEYTDTKKLKNILNSKQSKKSKKSMVHFDDPVEQIINLSTNTNKSKIKNISIANENSEQLIGLSRYLNITSPIFECNQNKNKRKSVDETFKLNKSDSSIDYFQTFNTKTSTEKVFKNLKNNILNEIKTPDIKSPKNTKSESYLKDKIRKSNRKEKNTTSNESNILLNSIQSTSINAKTDQNFISKNKMDVSNLDKSNQSKLSVVSNTSCITVEHSDESTVQLKKFDNPLNIKEYFKKPRVYEIITDDSDHEVVYLSLSETFTLLDIPSEVHHIQPSNQIASPLLTTNRELDITSEIEAGELISSDDIFMPAFSTPKDVEKKIEERRNRARRSPSFWKDSVHNYPINKYRENRHRESNHWRNKSYRGKYHDKKNWLNKLRYDERSQLDNRYHYQKNRRDLIKREFYDNSIRDKARFKHKEDKRRANYYERKERELIEEPKRFSNSHRMSQIDLQKLNRTDDIVKKSTKRTADRADHYKTPAKVSKVEHQRLLKNVDVDDFLSVVHGQK